MPACARAIQGDVRVQMLQVRLEPFRVVDAVLCDAEAHGALLSCIRVLPMVVHDRAWTELAVNVLVIDEVSMLNRDFFEAASTAL